MIEIKPSQNLAARLRSGRTCRGGASGRSLILFMLAGWLALVTPLRADNPPMYLFQIDSNAVPGGLEFDPNFVALDGSNNLYVSDTANSRIVKFSDSGTYLTQWGSYGTNNGQFSIPEGVAVDRSNNVYVVDYGRIEKFDSNGNYLTQWGRGGFGGGNFFSQPIGVAVDNSDNVYVADYEEVVIYKFTGSGTYLTSWQYREYQFQPYGVTVDKRNNVYVAEHLGTSPIVEFNSSGTYLAEWDWAQADDVAVDNNNNVYGTDTVNSQIEEFNGSGANLTLWGSFGSGNGQFANPVGIVVDSSGNVIYVADQGNSRIEIFVNNTNITRPYITLQPTKQVVAVGLNGTFSVGVVGTAPFSYQWYSNNVTVPGATNATFLLTNVSLSESGSTYSVLVTNNFGGESSLNALLAVLPAVAITLPASALTATGAVLNGSVTLGSDETVAWFDWGMDTNYGNIAGTTVVPGDNGSNNISAPLNGLPGDYYHYRLDAANDLGIVYGEDQLFTVGFVPAATTLAAITGANGSTLEAAVNPEGWDTTVYFQWGTLTLTHTTPGIAIGVGVTSLNISNFVSALAPSIPYQYRVAASNALGSAYGQVFYLDQPTQTNKHLFSGSETNITLSPGTYIITAYGAPGGSGYGGASGGLGAGLSAKFYFPISVTLTLLVGGGGGGGALSGGGGGGSFVVEGSTPLVISGGGGGGGVGTGSYPYGGGGDNGTVGTYGDDGGGFGGEDGEGGRASRGGYGAASDGGAGGGGFSGGGGTGASGGIGSSDSGGASFSGGGAGGVGGMDNPNGFGGYGGGGGGGGTTEIVGGYGGASGFGGGGGGGYSGGGGSYVYGGGGGGSIIDSSAITILAGVSGIASPDDPSNGEIIITAVPTPLGIITTDAAFGLTNGTFGFDVAGPSGSNVVIQASSDLQTWIPLQTNLLGSGPLYFSDPQSPTNVQRFYGAKFSP